MRDGDFVAVRTPVRATVWVVRAVVVVPRGDVMARDVVVRAEFVVPRDIVAR